MGGGLRGRNSWKESVMKCANPNCNREIGLIVYRRGRLSKRRYCSKHCRDAFVPQKLLTALKTFTLVAAFLAGGTALATAQNSPATGGETRRWLVAPGAAVPSTATSTIFLLTEAVRADGSGDPAAVKKSRR